MIALPKSIKWRLQFYYGFILLGVLVMLGTQEYELERGQRFHHVDQELQMRLDVLTVALHIPPIRHDEDEPPFERPPPGEFPGPPPGENLAAVAQYNSPQSVGFFDPTHPEKFYFVILARDGRELARSTNGRHPPDPREISRHLPSGNTILVGASMTADWKDLRLATMKYVALYGLIFFVCLAASSNLVSRALRPIESITEAAAKISGGDLSQRISTAETESELGQLATVLNSTFARLEAAFAQQKQFTSDAAHELRTPVAVILTQTQTALTRERSAAEYRETVEVCQRAAQRMRKLIGALLELARLDAGQEQMNQLEFDLSQTARDCVELIRPIAAQRGIKIDCQLQPTECLGDAERLAQVITNLLSNAIEYNHDNGEVRLTVQPQGSGAILSVANTGAGIAAADLPHLFERFYRADQSRTAAHNGLGLAISKAIVEAHGGTLEVSSAEAEKTTFTVRLPWVAPDWRFDH
ncbi:MAG TPA: ATP-binding protein [Candidatus Saccharimonadales bacterium]|nr:ATP-binding protein [Candidatus Saccharimonadales bacterium]